MGYGIAALARDLTPPLLVDALRRLRGPRTYRSFAEAASHSGGRYHSETLSRFRVERARLNLESLSALSLPPAYAFLLVAVHVARAGEPRIVDLGGSCGEWGYLLRAHARRPFRYQVVEEAGLARRCSADPAFDWATWSEEMPADVDIFVCSGTLQYLPDPYGTARAAFAAAREFVVLGRNSFCEAPLFRVQRTRLKDNGSGDVLPEGFDAEAEVAYPHQVVSLLRIVDLAARAGWRLKLQAESDGGVLPYRGLVFGRDLLFERSA
jgi:putative methyltransferase (TIGR04325 family)